MFQTLSAQLMSVPQFKNFTDSTSSMRDQVWICRIRLQALPKTIIETDFILWPTSQQSWTRMPSKFLLVNLIKFGLNLLSDSIYTWYRFGKIFLAQLGVWLVAGWNLALLLWTWL